MKSWSDTLQLPHPLRDVRLSGLAGEPFVPLEEQVRASYERGRIDGEHALGEQLVQQRAEMQNLFQGALNSLRGAVPQVVRDTEQMMVSLTLEIARKLVGDLPLSVEMVEAAVHEALAQVEGTADFQVRLHPADLELLQRAGSPLLSPVGDSREIRFHGSPEVTRGGCLVQTRFGIIDGRRETKFDLLKRSLLA
ncbi:MAG: hypothetical protein H7X97_03840 [Opitutaceae bacterium]|nr:hypothetical protein [Verrucomicrobiales bacterium]